ncbi:hypothetical protein [Streptococcus sobrinus]|uniref:Lipoprotein n=1 Tax=Streptococcus sobrinus W1703 TaxID=1227275 RepID=U2JFE5_9STRE|nr:hypothetical protein [Streptococcus sobrinus]ERJ78762.1 hypothetical protein HMPREF1557_00233 [Streptococcus sobrinus W1703]
MKNVQKVTSFVMLALTSLLLLGACQKNTSKSKTDHSTKTSQTSKKASKKKSTSSPSSSNQAPAQSSSQKQNSSQSQTNSNVNVAAVAQGDLSSIAGTYSGQNGAINFTVAADGTGTISKSDSDFQFQFSNYHQDGQSAAFSNQYGWNYYVVPAGVATPSGAQAASQWDDSNRDRLIVIGEGVNVFFLS